MFFQHSFFLLTFSSLVPYYVLLLPSSSLSPSSFLSFFTYSFFLPAYFHFNRTLSTPYNRHCFFSRSLPSPSSGLYPTLLPPHFLFSLALPSYPDIFKIPSRSLHFSQNSPHHSCLLLKTIFCISMCSVEFIVRESGIEVSSSNSSRGFHLMANTKADFGLQLLARKNSEFPIGCSLCGQICTRKKTTPLLVTETTVELKSCLLRLCATYIYINSPPTKPTLPIRRYGLLCANETESL